jgi:hypothetical protein
METTTTIPNFNLHGSDIAKLNDWIYEHTKDFISGRTLVAEDCSSPLSIVPLIHNMPLHLNASSDFVKRSLEAKYENDSLIRSVHIIDFYSTQFTIEYKSLLEAFATIVLLSKTTENKPFDDLVLKNIKELLTKGGNLIINTRPPTSSFEGLELSSFEWQHLDRRPLKNLLLGYEILKTRYFRLSQSDIQVIVIASKLG